MALKLVTKDGLLYYHQKLKAALADKVDKKEGYSLLSDAEISRLATLVNYDDTEVQATLQSLTGRIDALETADEDLNTLIEGIQSDITELQGSLKKHTDDTSAHVQTEDRTKWNAAEPNVIESVKVNGEALVPDEEKAVSLTVPSKTSELTNDSEFQSKTAVDSAIKTALGEYAKGAYKKLTSGEYGEDGVPTVEGEVGVIYLVPKNDGKSNNTYVEWIYTGESFEKIGDTEINLSNYVTKDDIISNEDIDAIWAS